MKYVYACAIILFLFAGVLCYTYSKGYKAGRNSLSAELQQTTEAQIRNALQASKKIIDNQVVISNNNDECFNRVWPDDVIRATNVLR